MPTETQYLQMVINKTSVLPRFCSKMLASILNLDEAQSISLSKYIEAMGASFQIQDDLIACVSDEYAKERGIIGEDIHEGKRTLMVIHSLAAENKKITDA